MIEADEALEAFRRWVTEAISPDDGPARTALAEAYAGMGLRRDAIELLESLVAQRPDYAPAHRLLARLLAKRSPP